MNFKKLGVAFAAAAAVMLSPFSTGTANAANAFQGPGVWQKVEGYYWNQTESNARTCFAETRPGNIPPDWNTTNYTPFFNGRDVIYGPGAVSYPC